MMNRVSLIAGASLVLIAGCASMPKNLPELDEARAVVRQLTSDPLASQSASTELQSARAALERADQAWEEKEPREDVIHLSYLAERQANIGQARLAEVRARQQIASAEADRNAVLLEARERQARLAMTQANASAREAELAQQAALAANQRTTAANERATSTLAELEETNRQLVELQATQTERGMVMTLGDVLFDTAQADLKPGAATTVDRLARFLQENPETRLLIEGYTDSRGSAEYNMDLSRRRAAAVSAALEARGMPSNRTNIAGRGELLPVASNETPAGRQLNRRVEIVFSDASGKFADGVARR